MGPPLVEGAMKGLLSSSPSPASVRIVVGTQLLFLVQTALIFQASAALDFALQALVVTTGTIGFAGLIAAIRGEAASEPTPWWRRRHAR